MKLRWQLINPQPGKSFFDNKVEQDEAIFYGLYNEKGFEFK